MQKKSTTKQQVTKLAQRIEKSLNTVNSLCETTPTPQYSAAPDPNILIYGLKNFTVNSCLGFA